MSKQFRRGFKAQADKLVRKFREELYLKYHDPLCPWKLASHLDIPIQALSTFREKIPDAVIHCMEREQESFSAVTLCLDDLKLIIHNDSHSSVRQAANIAHELAHIILKHTPMAVFDTNSCRYVDKEQEDEAEWLGPALLISKEAAIYILRTKMELTEAISIYGASKQVIDMRLNVSGARQIVSRSS
jgi:Zn-dependent peptidase ImmA (M78 family)